ncbi:Magnesium and cobalt efflux protein CorC [Roseimaritima multifibrata]|uniref:Magnesium and cobalt efflux protein CorC n=1 Tax=Roseimaritima multifibrata TaxID=1930274 RepID=A0A517MK56_9BACT|nr:hemolysin family protein [Roseimaritima multifibrata]QDS95272.1 Magnesium and cobalt efflux protein CorC [Roseimaritima multifibrata]
MTSLFVLFALLGFIAGAAGGLGAELLDRFAGRSLEAYCRLRHRRERFGAVLDGFEEAMRAAEYLRVIGSVVFLICGTATLYLDNAPPTGNHLILWGISATGLMMLTHLWLPGAVTRFASSPLLFHTWPFWKSLSIAMRPFAAPDLLFSLVTRRLAGKIEHEDEEEEQLEDDIRTMVAAGTREGFFGPGVREMIQGVMDLDDDTVGHIMTPRSEVNAIEVNTPWPEVLRFVIECGRTRMPVYDGTLDQIVGVLYAKDLMEELIEDGNPKVPLAKLLRNAWSVPVDRTVEQLLREFLHSRSHMAIVVDEFHQTVGVVTIEDVLEEIVGEIVDESDKQEESLVRIIDDHTAEASGRVMVDDLNELLGWDLPESEDYETIAGYILHHTGGIPEDGELLEIGSITAEIIQSTNRQIERVRLVHQANRKREAV